MASPPPNPKPQNPEKNLNLVLVDLHRAQKTAHQLSELIQIKGLGDKGKNLIDEIINTFSKVISALGSPEEAGFEHESSEVSNGKRKLNHVESHEKTNRPKRARQALATQKIMSKTMDDGRAWRKYGQKRILNSNNPRSYFRCTHKFDQGCQALKQVQKSDEDPNIFITTYTGNHTCKNPYSLFQLPSSPHESNGNSCFISFGSCTTNPFGNNKMNQNQDGLMSPRSFQSSKQEGGEEAEVLSKSTMAVDLAAARISEQAGPIRTGLNCSNEISNSADQLLDPSYDELEDIINYSDFVFLGHL
ncbi:hypothetical protein LUZ60_003913 [Juncus effusus]|nr:hypothetical protein LUZ60_003913 [Juncus effusus]